MYKTMEHLAAMPKFTKFLTNKMYEVFSPYYFLKNPIAELENALNEAGFSHFEVSIREDTEFYQDETVFKGKDLPSIWDDFF